MSSNAKNNLHVLNELEQPFEVSDRVKNIKVSNVYISKEIGPPSDYVELITRLRTADPNDEIFIHLNTPGGYVDTGVQIINAMRDCPGRVVTVMDGTVCSMGSLIFLAADEYIVHENSRLMFHNYSGGTFGKGNEQIAQLSSTVEWYSSMFFQICFPFLDEEEMEAIINGQDMWLNSDETKERLEKVVKYMEAEQKRLAEEEEIKSAKTRKKQLLAELKKIEKIEAKQTSKKHTIKTPSSTKNESATEGS